MANLFQINSEIAGAWDQAIDPETGEILNDEFFAIIDKLELEKEQKIENIACYIKNLVADAEALKKEKDSFAAREKQTKNKIENLKEYLAKALNGEKFSSAKCVVSFRKSQKVNITDATKLDDDYLKYEDPKVDKDKIKRALKDGVKIEGAELIDNVSTIIK